MDALHALIVLANFVIVPAIAYGSQLALGALGITLIVGVLRFSNFAHGETMAFGTMVVILVTWWFQSIGLSIHPLPTALIALPFGILGCVAIVLLTDKFVYKFYRKTKSAHLSQALFSGLSSGLFSLFSDFSLNFFRFSLNLFR